MGEHTKIEWCDHTFNPWLGCQKVSPGCDNCYAEAMMDHRYGKVEWGPHGERVRTSVAYWRKPLQWAREAEATGKRPRVFCASLADVFDNQVPAAWRIALFALILNTPQLDWLLLTKRPENIRKMVPLFWQGPPLANVWLGTTAEDQEHFDKRWPILRAVPAPVHFISYEPALGPLRLWEDDGEVPLRLPFPDWLICGGESGGNARRMSPAWASEIKADCEHLGVAFFMKQMTKKAAIPADLLVRQFPRPRT